MRIPSLLPFASVSAGSILALAPHLAAQTDAGTDPAPTRQAITHEDIWTMRRVGTPSISPDGALAVFSVTEPSYDASENRTDLWAVATDGHSEPRRLTSTPGGEGGVTWSPDGSRIAFTARRAVSYTHLTLPTKA